VREPARTSIMGDLKRVKAQDLGNVHTPTVYVVIPTLNRCAIVLGCLNSLHDQSYAHVTIVVADAGSTDSTPEHVRTAFPDVLLVQCGSDKWWAGATNMGVREILGVAKPTDLVLTLNDDTVCSADYVATLVAGHRGRQAILGSVALEAGTSTVLDAGVGVNWWTAKFIRRCRGRTLDECGGALSGLAPVDLLSGRGTLVPVMAYREIGLYAEKALPHYGADYEFTARARRRGWSIEVCGSARLQSYSHMTGIDPSIAPLSLVAMMRSLVSRRSSNCLWYRWVFAAQACPRPQLLAFMPLDTVRVLGGMLRRQYRFRLGHHPNRLSK